MSKTVKNREEALASLFGPSKTNVPTESLTYIRKNPKRFVQKITEIYGLNSVVKWVGEKAYFLKNKFIYKGRQMYSPLYLYVITKIKN